MAKTTKEFLKSAADTERANQGRESAGTAPDAGRVLPFVPDEGAQVVQPEVPVVGVEPANPMQHDPARPGLPGWELNTVPSNAQ